jgi:hypothetical protein
LPITIAVPVSWQEGSTPPAAMFAFRSSSSATKLGEVPGPQQVGDVVHRLAREPREALELDAEERLARGLEGRDVVLRDEPVGRLVLAEGQHLLELEVAHRGSPASGARARFAWIAAARAAGQRDPRASTPRSKNEDGLRRLCLQRLGRTRRGRMTVGPWAMSLLSVTASTTSIGWERWDVLLRALAARVKAGNRRPER